MTLWKNLNSELNIKYNDKYYRGMNEMGLFRKHDNQKMKPKDKVYMDIIEEVNNCKSKDLEVLLQKIELELEKKGEKDKELLSAKTMVTSRIAVKNNSKN